MIPPAVLVLAAESCGGRWVANWLYDNGCAVTHFSWPHGPSGQRSYPRQAARQWADDHPGGCVLALVREPTFVAASAPQHHEVTPTAATRHVLDAAAFAYSLIARGSRVRLLVYEALVGWPRATTEGVAGFLEWPLEPPVEVVDGNTPHVPTM